MDDSVIAIVSETHSEGLMLITSGMLWKRRDGSPTQRAGERALVCVLQDEELTNASGLEVFSPN